MKHKLLDIGCDNETVDAFNLPEEQYEFLCDLNEELNENSRYVCMPTINIQRFLEPKRSDSHG
jgi:hypothetical protein